MRKVEIPPFTPEENALQRDMICAYIDRERDIWLGARAAADRAIGLDANLNAQRDKSLRHIDNMLDELIEIEGVRYV